MDYYQILWNEIFDKKYKIGVVNKSLMSVYLDDYRRYTHLKDANEISPDVIEFFRVSDKEIRKVLYKTGNEYSRNKGFEKLLHNYCGDATDSQEEIYDELTVETGADYLKADVPSALKSGGEPLNTPINSGSTFNAENTKLKKLVSRIESEINSIRADGNFTNRYAVVHGGDDGTEFSQLQTRKESSERSYKKIAEWQEKESTPYRYRVDVEENGKIKTYYLGAASIDDLGKDNRVISFYSAFGKRLATYNASDEDINRRINLRREFLIRKSKLISYTNLNGSAVGGKNYFKEGFTDAFLIEVFESRRAEHEIKDIILTIQDNQNKIVEADKDRHIIVQGCAGSGKTMVMMHRLSRLQNWVHAFDVGEILIITPNDSFKMYTKALMEGLSISSLQQSTLESYFNDILRMYNKDFVVKGKIASDINVNPTILEYVYSDSFVKDFNDIYKLMIDARYHLASSIESVYRKLSIYITIPMPKSEDEIPNYLMKIITHLKDKKDTQNKEIQKKEAQLEGLRKRLDSVENNELNKIQLDYDSLLRSSFDEVKSKIQKMNNRSVPLEKLLNEVSNTPDEAAMELFIYKAQRYLPEIEEIVLSLERLETEISTLEFESNGKPNRIREVEEELSILKGQAISQEIQEEIEELYNVAKETSHFKTFKKVYELTFEQAFENQDIKKPRGIHRYDLYARLLFCKKYFSKELDLRTFICIDEGQDISLNEYKLLLDLGNEKTTFNIFGDTKQLLIPERGINDWKELEKIINPRKYILNENYRNTNQITAFCNSEFGMSMRKIGINGKNVTRIDIEELKQIINSASTKLKDERWVILIPRTITKKNLELILSSKIVSSNKIGKNIISLMYVDEIKGFEFDKAFVFDSDMNSNYRYVAYTRALNELYIVSQ